LECVSEDAVLTIILSSTMDTSGMSALLNDKIYDDRSYFSVLIAGLLIAGLMSMVIGLYYLNFVSNFMTVDNNAYNMAKFIMMFFVMVIGVYGLWKGHVLEGLFLLFIGMATFIFAATYLLGAADGLMTADIIIGACLLAFALGFYLKGDFLLCIASAIMGFGGAFYSLFSGDALFLLIGLGCLISGIVEFAYAVLAWNRLSSQPESFSWLSAAEDCTVIRSAGYPLMAVLLLLVGAYYLNVVLGFTVMDTVPYNITKTILSLVVLSIAVLAFRHADYTVGLIFLLMGSSTLTFSAAVLTGNGTGLEVLDLFLGISALIAAGMAYKQGELDLALASFFIFLGIGIYVFLSGDVIYYVVSLPLLAAGVVFLLSGLRSIMRYEVNRAL